eukprot:NODE_7521_length_435_cov_275.026316.p2 GENE.NODE_7521_length_435_cov_275.026316~~NODE_7521_length_435_cov_275.026316.p2  ORF type:complete len:82 (+),score=37.67 NODE_7521_length_435_cov_275.026316:72-317(+)
MASSGLQDDELDDEDRAALAELSLKGYYHNRPKSGECPPPTRIVDEAPAADQRRTDFDEFQRKWDHFDDEKDDEDHVKEVR